MIKYHNLKLHINVTAVGREGEEGEECDINFQVTEEGWILSDFILQKPCSDSITFKCLLVILWHCQVI